MIYFFGLAPNLFLPFDPSCTSRTKTYKPIIGINDNNTNHPDLFESWILLTAAAYIGIKFAIITIENNNAKSPWKTKDKA